MIGDFMYYIIFCHWTNKAIIHNIDFTLSNIHNYI